MITCTCNRTPVSMRIRSSTGITSTGIGTDVGIAQVSAPALVPGANVTRARGSSRRADTVSVRSETSPADQGSQRGEGDPSRVKQTPSCRKPYYRQLEPALLSIVDLRTTSL